MNKEFLKSIFPREFSHEIRHEEKSLKISFCFLQLSIYINQKKSDFIGVNFPFMQRMMTVFFTLLKSVLIRL